MKPRAPGVLGDGRRGGGEPGPCAALPHAAGPPTQTLWPALLHRRVQDRTSSCDPLRCTPGPPPSLSPGIRILVTLNSRLLNPRPGVPAPQVPGLTPPVAPAHSLQPSSCPQPLLAPPPGFLQSCPLPFQLSPLPSGPWPLTPRSGGCTERGGARSVQRPQGACSPVPSQPCRSPPVPPAPPPPFPPSLPSPLALTPAGCSP